MKQFAGFKSEAPSQGFGMLPKGAYVTVIQNVRIEGNEPDQRLVIRLEITEGEHTGYYSRRYKYDTDNSSGKYDVRYKGDYKLQIPDSSNTNRQHPEWDLRSFNNAIWAIEQSNPGYHWDWNENGLKGKTVGINVRQGTFNGIPYTTIGRLEDVNLVRAGKVQPMKDMAPRQQFADANDSGFTMVESEEIPF